MKVIFEQVDRFKLIAENNADNCLLNYLLNHGELEAYTLTMVNNGTPDSFEDCRENELTFQLREGYVRTELKPFQEVLRLIPAYREAEVSLGTLYGGQKDPLKEAKQWIEKQQEPKSELTAMVKTSDKVYQVKGKKKIYASIDIPDIYDRVRRRTIVFPDDYKIEKIIISKEK